VVVIDTSTFTIIDTIVLSGYPADIAVSPDGAWLYACAPGEVLLWVIDTHTNSIYTTISGINAYSLDTTRGGEFLYAGGRTAGGQNGRVWVIDAHTFTPITSLDIDRVGIDVALTNDETQLYVGMPYGNQVAVIDTATFTVTSTITLPGDEPVSIAMDPEYIGRAVFLDPITQTGEGGRGQVIEYTVTLTNFTTLTDTFNLSLGASAWESSLSTDQIGPLPDGGSASFSIYVTVPQGASWYASDTVTVTADSLTNPGVYTATAQVTTVAYAPPHISVEPLNLQSSQFVGQETTQVLTISNGVGVTLTYEISTGLDASWLSAEPVSGSVPTDSYNPVQVTFDATDLLPDLYTTTLLINHNDASQPPISIPVTLTVVQPQADVVITPTEAGLSGSPGETVVYTFTLTNLGDLADNFTLEVSSTWTTTLSVTSTGELQAGEMYIFVVYVTIPLDVDDGAHDMALVTATSAYDPQVSAEVQATTSAVIQPVEVQFLYLPLIYKT
jgi:YVTN family beta-propeller protein